MEISKSKKLLYASLVSSVALFLLSFAYAEPSCTPHAYKQCFFNQVYWYDSCGNREELFQDCGVDEWTDNYQCLGSTWLQRQKIIRWCSDGTCQQSTTYQNYQDCSALSQICQNNQCVYGYTNRYLSCYDNDLYWFDSYYGRQEKYQDCGDSYCTDSGYNYCVGNSVYRQRTCYNRGCAGNACYSTTTYSDTQLVQTCGYGQTCQSGYCTGSYCECSSGLCCDGCHYKSSSVICNSETQQEYGCPWGSACGSDTGVRTKIRYQYCSGYSASCTGAWSNWSGLSDWTVVNYCSNTQTCIYGNPTCQPKAECSTPSPPSYVFRSYKVCYDNDVYWYDSRGERQDKYRECTDTNNCTIDNCQDAKCVNELKCDGSTCSIGSSNYCNSCSHCGDGICNCAETITSCSQDCGVIGLAVTIFGKKENEPVQWLKTVSSSAGQKFDFLVVVSNGQDSPMNNVTLKTDLPPEIIYQGDLKLDANSYDGDIRTGINLGTLAAKAVRTLTFKGEVAADLSRTEADLIATVITLSGSSADNVKMLFPGGGQIITKPEGGLAAVLKFDLKKPLYILIGIVLAILVLLGLTKVFQGLKKEPAQGPIEAI